MKLELPEHKKQVFELVIPIRWGDMDAMGHVNNTVYFRYMETLRIDWFAAIGCPVNPHAQWPVIVNAFCNFYKQFEFQGGFPQPNGRDPARLDAGLGQRLSAVAVVQARTPCAQASGGRCRGATHRTPLVGMALQPIL